MDGEVQRGADLAFSFVYWFFLLAGTAYLLAVLATPLLIQSDDRLAVGFSALLYIANVYMCMQLPERSFQLFGQFLSLDARVLAMVAGSMLAFPFALLRDRMPPFTTSMWFPIAGVALLGIDGTTQLFGMRESNNSLRLFTGLLAGFAVVFFLLYQLHEKRKLYSGPLVHASALFALVVVAVLAASYYVGGFYLTKEKAIRMASADATAQYIEAFYIAPNAFAHSVRHDSYLRTYSDPILSDIARMRTQEHPYGAWAVLLLDEPPKHEGKHAFISGGKGTYYYYDAWSGELVGRFEHAS